LAHALSLATHPRAAVTVATVAPQERTDLGCGHCRANAAWRNDIVRHAAREWLSELAEELGDAPTVNYVAACGPTTPMLALVAERYEADTIVLPWRRGERLRRLLRTSTFEQLERRGRWEIVVAPR
jgi:nucleotide-binding universal stress UspA family protein